MRRTAATALALLASAGCGDGLQFERDERLRFVRPPDRAEVTLPLVVEWTMRDRAAPAPGGARRRPGAEVFAAFVDRPPMRPGEDLDSLAEDADPTCARVPGCPDRRWLEEHGVLVSGQPRVAIRWLDADRGRPARGGLRRHEVTVVLLDARGVRQGEAAWRRTIYLAHRR